MKNIVLFVLANLAVLFTSICSGQVVGQKSDFPISRFSLSINPLGVIQVGPVINAEIGLTENLVLNTHCRFPTLGVLSYTAHNVDIEDDVMHAFAFGGGFIFFPGKNKSKPYVGLLFEYEKAEKIFDVGERYEEEGISKTTIFMVNGGYRFRFDYGFFINTGVYLGAYLSRWSEEYTDKSYSIETDSGTNYQGFGMFELSLGIEF